MIPRDFDVSSPSAVPPSPSPTPSSQPQQYRVQRSDTSLDSIAQHFGVTRDAIVQANPGKFANSLNVVPGDVLTIPSSDENVASSSTTTQPAASPQQQVDKALSDLHTAQQARPHNRMEAQDLADSRTQLQNDLNKAVDAEVQARLAEKPPVDTSLTPQQRKALGETAPSLADRASDIRKDILARYKGDADIQKAVDTQEAKTLLDSVDNGTYNSPKDKLLALDAALKSASSDQVRTVASQQDAYRSIVHAASAWAAQPYDGNIQFKDDGQFVKALQGADDSSSRYVSLLSGISSPQMRADLIAEATPQLDKLAHFAINYHSEDRDLHVTSTLSNLSSIVGTLGQQDQAAAQSLASEFAGQVNGRVWDGGTFGDISMLTEAARQSGDPTLALSIAQQVRKDGNDRIANEWADSARDQIFQTVADAHHKVDADLQNYVGLTGELSSLIDKEGQSMTPDQLNSAIDKYRAYKGAGWEQNVAQAQQQLATDGKALLSQESSLGAWFAAHPDDAAAAGDKLKPLVNSQSAQAAIRLAVQEDPSLMQGPKGQSMITFLAQAGKVADQGGRKLIQELGTNYVQGRMNALRSALKASDDVASHTRVIDQLTELGDNKQLATLLGMSDGKVVDLKAATEVLKNDLNSFKALADTEKNPDALAAALKSSLDNTSNKLGAIKGFASGTPISSIFRAFSAGAAGLSLASAYDKMTTSNSNQLDQFRNELSTLISAAGFSQKTAGLVVSMGWADRGSWVDKVGARAVDHSVNYLSGGIDIWKAGQSFLDGDAADGTFYSMTGVGSMMWAAGNAAAGGEGLLAGTFADFSVAGAAGSWAGPIGIGLVALGTMGLMAYQSKKANDQAVPGREAFLQGLGYHQSAADALAAWHSKDDVPATSMLLRYGQLHGLDAQQTMAWFNGLGADAQKTFAGAMLSALDGVGGDASKFNATDANDHNWDDMAKHNELITGTVNHGVFGSGPGVLLDESKLAVASGGLALNEEEQPGSAHQLDVTLQDLLGATPPA